MYRVRSTIARLRWPRELMRTTRGIAMVAVLGVVLAACASTTSGPVSSTKTITWFVRTQPAENAWEVQVIAQYEKLHPLVHIHRIIVPESEFDSKLDALYAAGTPPDIFNHWGVDGFADYYAKGMIQSISPYIKKYHFNINQIPAGVLKFSVHKGQYWGIPITTAPTFIVYNKTLFEKHHLPIPPTSWTDKSWNYKTFMHDAQVLTTNTGNAATETWGFNPWGASWGPRWTYAWLWNGDPFSKTGGRTNEAAYRTGVVTTADAATNPGVVDAVRWLAGLVKAHISPVPASGAAAGAAPDPMFSGRVGMEGDIMFWLAEAPTIKPTFKWGLAPLPWMTSTQPTGPRFTDIWMLAKGASHPNTAFQFMEYISSGKGLDEYLAATHRLPAIPSLAPIVFKGIAATPGFSMSMAGLKQVLLGGVKYSHESPNHTLINYPQWYHVWNAETADIWDGSTSPSAALHTIDTDWQAMIKAGVK